MIVFCDRLNLGSCIKTIQIGRRNLFNRRGVCQIQTLDPLPQSGLPRLLQIIMQSLGFQLSEAKFHAGKLIGHNGQPIVFASSTVSSELAFQSAARIALHSDFVTRLNERWQRNTILKHIAQSVHFPATMRITMQFMAAEALSCAANERNAYLVVERPVILDIDELRKLSPNLEVRYYQPLIRQSGGVSFISPTKYEFLKRMRGSALFLILVYSMKELRLWLTHLVFRQSINWKSKADSRKS